MHLPSLTRRYIHTCTNNTHIRLHELLHETAQSIVVVTTCLPNLSATYHGATLSSFTSITLDPLPLVAFSLCIPSQMVSTLNTHASATFSSPLAHLVINLLSAVQPHLADHFARPDLHLCPFADPRVQWMLSRDGLPILLSTLGILKCYPVGPSVPLAHLGSHGVPNDGIRHVGEGEDGGGEEVLQASAGAGLASKLFITRVLHVKCVPLPEGKERDAALCKLLLLYHQCRYMTVEDQDHSNP
ncbi:flavin reductase like domain-containing protein [Boletus coccyginus]|nr:flavin reductase like domain-containing protein [Boletus coccyginus]